MAATSNRFDVTTVKELEYADMLANYGEIIDNEFVK